MPERASIFESNVAEPGAIGVTVDEHPNRPRAAGGNPS
jgi:hypothetical protein